MSDTKTYATDLARFDRPSENQTLINTENAPWHDDCRRNVNDKSQHRRYHSLFEDMMN
ncbi:MAG: hypothetical protein ABJM43_00115 [Paracoccaceae bacterium]